MRTVCCPHGAHVDCDGVVIVVAPFARAEVVRKPAAVSTSTQQSLRTLLEVQKFLGFRFSVVCDCLINALWSRMTFSR